MNKIRKCLCCGKKLEVVDFLTCNVCDKFNKDISYLLCDNYEKYGIDFVYLDLFVRVIKNEYSKFRKLEVGGKNAKTK